MGIFNAAEIVDLGIEKEIKRRDFYGAVASLFRESDVNKLFKELRDWEDTHIKKFSDIRKAVDADETFESYEGEFEKYMRALVDDKLYSQVDPVNFSKNIKSPLDAIRYGMEFEKDAILFFSELESKMSDGIKSIVTELVSEEKKHLIYLSELKKRYNK